MSESTPFPVMPWRRPGLALLISAALAGCATSPNPKDPFENFNRAMFTFNDTVDQAALKPAATAYKKVLPSFVQTGVGNFFGNLADVWTAVNNMLQGKGADGFSDVTRVALNSTFGILGLFDIASEAGLQKHNKDFGMTLGYWGVEAGPYLMLPLLGPSTLRDTTALPLDFYGDLWSYKYPVYLRNIGTAVRAVDKRAALLDASNLMEDAALDRYDFVRDSYLQRRESRIFDGEAGSRDRKKDSAPKPATEEPDVKKPDAGVIEAPLSSASASQELSVDTPAATDAGQ